MKNFIVNCAICDMRNVSEETLQGYDSVTVNAATVYITQRVKELIAKYPVTLNVADVLELAEGEQVAVQVQNGVFEIGPGDLSDKKRMLLVNGSLNILPDALEAAQSYGKINVNGTVSMPRSFSGQLSNLSVNGSASTYPDGAILLKRTAIIDALFPLRAKKALYWAARRLVFLDGKLDCEALAKTGATFSGKEAIIAESLVRGVAPLLDEQTELTIVPDGTVFVNDDGKLTKSFFSRYGAKVYVNGDLEVPKDGGELLEKMEYVQVNGDVKLSESLEEALQGVNIQYKELVLLKEKGKVFSEKLSVTVDERLLNKYPDGITVSECASVKIDKGVSPELIEERLQIRECATVKCTEEQRSAVEEVCEEVAQITTEDKKEGLLAQMFNPDNKVINAVQYTL